MMFTKIFSIAYLAQTYLAVIVIINGLEAVVVQPGWAQTSVLSQQLSTTEPTEELIINGTLNENSELFEDDGSYFQKHSFAGKAGDAITIELSSSEFDAYLILIDPKLKEIAKNDDGGEGSNGKITITLPTTGTYTVIVKAYEKGQQGSYKLSWGEASAKDQSLGSATELNEKAIELYQQGEYDEAVPLLEQSLEIRQQVLGAEHPDVATSLNNLAALYASQGNIASALQFLERSLEVEEKNLTYNLATGAEPQKEKYLKTVSGSKNRAISLHLQAAPDNPTATALAFTTILRRKGRLLDFLITNRKLLRQQLDSQGQQWLDELNNINSQLSTLLYNPPKNIRPETYRNAFAKLEEQAKELEDKIGRLNSQFRAATQPVTLEAIQQLIPLNAALVEFVQYSPYEPKTDTLGKPRYGVYVLGAEGEPQGVDLGTVEEIESAIPNFRFSLRDKKTSLEQLKGAGRVIDEKLMQPVRKLLGSQQQILISPDGNLNLLPFEALVDENDRFLLENYSFTYLSSGRDLLRFTSPSRNTSPVVLLGNPKYREKDKVAIKPDKSGRSFENIPEAVFRGLPGTAEEVKAIGQLLGVEPLLRGAATEEALKQVQSPFILHIATHAFFDERQNPPELPTIDRESLLRSSLVMAGAKEEKIVGDNGFLTALEATGLNLLGTELVVLSACDTGLGEISPGEGVYGLRRAFAIAGSQSQLISLWKVDDKGTKELMVKYYQRLLNGKIGRTEALRKTQLEMLRKKTEKDYSHPYYWASFILSGNWRSIVQTEVNPPKGEVKNNIL